MVFMIAGSWFPFLTAIAGPPTKTPIIPLALVLIVFGTFFPILLWKTKLVVTVDTEFLAIAFTGIGYARKKIPLAEIGQASVREYAPMKEFGGWGMKSSRKYGHAYTMSGNRGVQLELSNGKKILLGSQRPEELAAALNNRAGS